ncbi:uncharacterized protein LOC116620705 isoform X2 [Nematostella vectensis]|uniref:uncharacterized protein LOC116620705 isoform X2 n=1 Tax=Nematostella vectensis TaxID=45351 RepID=UPI0013904B58|nr:uncharacterized protein LOC116620705 isoform X2 [Nematostella vectensis]
MAFNRRHTRLSAVAQILLGCLCLIFGLAEQTHGLPRVFTVELALAVWSGVLVCMTGVLGVMATRRQHENTPKIVLIAIYLGFSLAAFILAFALTGCYGFAVPDLLNRSECSTNSDYKPSGHPEYNLHPSFHRLGAPSGPQCKTKLALVAIIVFLAMVELGVSLWAIICCCKAGRCFEPLPRFDVVFDKSETTTTYRRVDHEEDLLLVRDGESMV